MRQIIPTPVAKFCRKGLDGFFHCRQWLATLVTYLSISFFGSEVSWDEVKNGRIKSPPHSDRDLNAAQDLDLLLTEAKSRLAESEARRSGNLDKCKTLLTLSSFVLTAAGLILSRTAINDTWTQVILLLTVLCLLHVVILLCMQFAVRAEMRVSIDQEDVSLSREDLRKSLINSYLRCQVNRESRVDFLIEIFKSARLFFLLGLMMLIAVLLSSFLKSSNDKLAASVASELMKDPQFIESVEATFRTHSASEAPYESQENTIEPVEPEQPMGNESHGRVEEGQKEPIPRDSGTTDRESESSKDKKSADNAAINHSPSLKQPGENPSRSSDLDLVAPAEGPPSD